MPKHPAPLAARPAPIGRAPVTPHLFEPTAARPLRAKQQQLAWRDQVVPHRHAWAQLALSRGGVLRLTADHGTYLVPPSRAVWIPPAVEHAVTAVEDATLLTLYLHQPTGQCGPAVPAAEQAAWRQCRVLEVSDLLQALVQQLPTTPDDAASAAAAPGAGSSPPTDANAQREGWIAALVLDELRRARPLRLGLPLPADKRLRQLCEAVIDQPARHATLDGWAQDAGASARTLARLFRSELGTSFGQWRQQALLAQALARAARGQPVSLIAAELGYASASAFSAMVRRTVGQTPSDFFGQAPLSAP